MFVRSKKCTQKLLNSKQNEVQMWTRPGEDCLKLGENAVKNGQI